MGGGIHRFLTKAVHSKMLKRYQYITKDRKRAWLGSLPRKCLENTLHFLEFLCNLVDFLAKRVSPLPTDMCQKPQHRNFTIFSYWVGICDYSLSFSLIQSSPY